MTKSIRFFIWLLIGFSTLAFSYRIALAQFILSPLAQTNSDPSTNYEQPTTNSLSFGEILGLSSSDSATPYPPIPSTYPATPTNYELRTTNSSPSSSLSPASIMAFLSRLDLSSEEAQKALVAFLANQNTSSSDPLRTTDYGLSTTSIIPIPTLIASVESFISPAPTYTEKTLAFLGSITSTPFPSADTGSYSMKIAQIPEQEQIIPFPSPENEPSSIQHFGSTSKTHYTIALLGDSMTDTLGPDLPQLKKILSESYPGYTFALLNYGFGSTDMESGLYRLTNTTNYLGKTFPPLLSYNPDIVVVESFAYNHWSGELSDLNRQWLTIAHIIDAIKARSGASQIVLAATISPNPFIFGDGVLNWPENLKWQSSIITKAYEQNMINFATSQYYPLADAYHPSLRSDGHGDPRYISSYDHLHPSDEGKLLYSEKIVDAIKNNNLIY